MRIRIRILMDALRQREQKNRTRKLFIYKLSWLFFLSFFLKALWQHFQKLLVNFLFISPSSGPCVAEPVRSATDVKKARVSNIKQFLKNFLPNPTETHSFQLIVIGVPVVSGYQSSFLPIFNMIVNFFWVGTGPFWTGLVISNLFSTLVHRYFTPRLN